MPSRPAEHMRRTAIEILKKYFVTDTLSKISGSSEMAVENSRDFKKIIQAHLFKDKTEVLRVIGEFSDAFDLLEKGIAYGTEAKDLRTETNLRLSCCNTMWETGRYEDMVPAVEKTRTMMKKLDDPVGSFEALNLLGLAMSGLGKYDESLGYFEQAYEKCMKLKDKLREATIVNNIGEISYAKGDFEHALKYFDDAIRIEADLGDIRREAIGFNNVGSIHYILDESEPALACYTRALNIFKKVGDKRNEAMLLNNIGTIHDDLGKFKEGLKYYEEAVGIQEMIHDKIGAATTYNNIGYILYELGEYCKALEYFKKGYDGWYEMGYRRGEVVIYKNIAAVHLELKDWDNAQHAIQKADKSLEELPNDEYSRTVTLLKAKLALALDRLEEAQNYASLSLSLAEKLKKDMGRAEALVVLGRVHARKEDYEQMQQRFDEALRIIEKSKQAFHHAETCYYYAQSCAKFDPKTTKKYLKKALDFFSEAGSQVWVERCKEMEV